MPAHTSGAAADIPEMVSAGGSSALSVASSGAAASSRSFIAASCAASAAAAAASWPLRMAAGALLARAMALSAAAQPLGSTVNWAMMLLFCSA